MASSSSHLPKSNLLSPPPPPPSQPPSHHHHLLKKPTDFTTTTSKKRKLHSSTSSSDHHTTTAAAENDNDILAPSIQDISLSSSSHLTHEELLRRRLHRLRRLSRVYRDHYWALMEDLRVQYREYYWKYGVSPCKDEEERESGGGGGGERELCGLNNVEGCGESNNNNNNNGGGGGSCVIGGKLGLGFGENNEKEVKIGGNNRCALVSCKLKAMALTSFCYLHILSDPQQQLYKACNAIIKIAQQGPILCGRPILKSTIPSLCNIHFPKTQKDVKHALKKAGLNVSSSTKLAPKFHAIIAEYVHLIQSKRRAARKNNHKCVVVKEESPS